MNSADGDRAVAELVAGMDEIDVRVGAIAEGIRELAVRSEAIGAITASVRDLAEQSNMLALNATIEAAKAGEQGRGFAVVADEVRNLAEQSKQATVQVQQILVEIRDATKAAVSAPCVTIVCSARPRSRPPSCSPAPRPRRTASSSASPPAAPAAPTTRSAGCSRS